MKTLPNNADLIRILHDVTEFLCTYLRSSDILYYSQLLLSLKNKQKFLHTIDKNECVAKKYQQTTTFVIVLFKEKKNIDKIS